MTGEVATTTGLAQWRPALDGLPEGWRIVEVVLRREYQLERAEAILRYDPFNPSVYHEVRVHLAPHTKPVTEWLFPILRALQAEPYPAFLDIDADQRRGGW